MTDTVHHPHHYTHGEIETIDYIRDKLSQTEFAGYCLGNCLKYLSRWRHKGGVEDLRKARVYLDWAIDRETVDDKVEQFFAASPKEFERESCPGIQVEEIEPTDFEILAGRAGG